MNPSDFFFFNDTATTEIYTLSLHDALPISPYGPEPTSTFFLPFTSAGFVNGFGPGAVGGWKRTVCAAASSEPSPPQPDAPKIGEHTSELQSRQYLVCRLLLEKKKNKSRKRT